ncbi:Flp pilus assembly protein CpaB [Pseudoalteromonas sp. TB64]|uniref:Flp pilus assembly protein CpaB n=1 Tax=Pseudoalteromonas sp. TB64 TaxID=1938600 RepID=UPI0004285979|nr:Flp pilus assembly protein CpaB [Pseudoalteromonas sp. TB64]
MKIKNLLNKNWVLLTVSVILGLIAAFSIGKYMELKEEQLRVTYSQDDVIKVPIVVVTRSLVKGSIIDKSMVAVRQIPSDYLPAGYLNPNEFPEVEGQMLLENLSTGQPLLRPYLPGKGFDQFSDMLKDGRRAVTIKIDENNSNAGMLVAGDKVDLYLLSEKTKGTPQLDLLIERVKVLATGKITAADNKDLVNEIYKDPTNYSTVTLDVSLLNAGRVSLAKEHGKFVALLRNRNDDLVVLETNIDSSSLFPSNKKEREVEMIIGGSGNIAKSVKSYVKEPNNSNSLTSKNNNNL